MKQILTQYASYNLWANQKILAEIGKLTPEQLNREIGSSFPSVLLTVSHMRDAESMWWQRVKLVEHPVRPSEHFSGMPAELFAALLDQSKQWKEWVDSASEAQLQHVFAYHNPKKEYFKSPVYQTLLHVVNHATYHRGQLITMLWQLGVTIIPNTDFSAYARQNLKM